MSFCFGIQALATGYLLEEFGNVQPFKGYTLSA